MPYLRRPIFPPRVSRPEPLTPSQRQARIAELEARKVNLQNAPVEPYVGRWDRPRTTTRELIASIDLELAALRRVSVAVDDDFAAMVGGGAP